MSEPQLPTPLASTAMEAARDIRGFIGKDPYVTEKFTEMLDGPLAAMIQKHFQPLLAKVEGERDAAVKQQRSFFDKMNQINQWYAELIDVVYGELPEGINERPDPRAFVKARYDELIALRADLAAKEAEAQGYRTALAAIKHFPACELFSYEVVGMKEVASSALASRADKGGAT